MFDYVMGFGTILQINIMAWNLITDIILDFYIGGMVDRN